MKLVPGSAQEIHESVTLERVIELAELRLYSLENPGICLACAAEVNFCEPDARNLKCPACDRAMVFGAEEVLVNRLYHHPHKQ